MLRAAGLVLAAVLVLGACSDPTEGNEPLGEAAPVTLTQSGGCGEAYLWAATDDGTVVVIIAVDATDRSTTEPTTIAVDLPDGAIEAHVLQGDRDITRDLCTDVIDVDAEPDRTVPLVTGEGEIILDPAVEEGVPLTCGDRQGSAHLTGLRNADGMPFAPVTIETSGIGCYSG